MVEFKEDTRTGQAYIMEINGRFWGSLQLAIDSGIDFPRLLVECATGKSPSPPPPHRVGIRSRWLWGDVDHLLAVFRASDSSPRHWMTALGRFSLPWRPGDRFEVLRIRDPGPFLAESSNWFSSSFRGSPAEKEQ